MTDATQTHEPKQRRRKTHELPKEKRDEIIALKQRGYGKRLIATRIGRSSKEVAKVLREEGLLPPPVPAASKLEAFLEEISMRVQSGLTTSRILRKIRDLGYRGGRTILATRVAALRTQLTLVPANPTKRRFETARAKRPRLTSRPTASGSPAASSGSTPLPSSCATRAGSPCASSARSAPAPYSMASPAPSCTSMASPSVSSWTT